MSSNKIRRGWTRTFEKNDADAWKKQQRQILSEGGIRSHADNESQKPIQSNFSKKKKKRC